MDAVADIEPVEIHDDPLGDVVDRADHLDAMPHDVENAAAAQPGGALVIDEHDRHRDGDLGAGADPQEIDMQWRIRYRMVLHIARQGAVRRTVELHVDQMREEAGPRQRATQLARLEADQHRFLLVAIDDRGDAPRAPHRPGRALADALARLGAEADDLGHRLVTPLSNTAWRAGGEFFRR